MKLTGQYRAKDTDLRTKSTPREDKPSGHHEPFRHRLPQDRLGLTHKFSIAGHEGYINVGLYPSGQVGEIFIQMSKSGSTISGLLDGFAIQTSLALQYNVPLEVMIDKFKHARFPPSGVTKTAEVPDCVSILDYIFRWLEQRFMGAPDGDT